jgi:hypothetical protein
MRTPGGARVRPVAAEQQLARGWAQLPPELSPQQWRPWLLSVQRAEVAGLHLAEVDLRACRFAGAHNLDRLRAEGAPLFTRTPGWWRARRKTLAEEQHWRATRPGRWRAAGWYPRVCQPPASPKAEAPGVVEPARLAALYRELRKGREDAKDEPGAADFYYGEMEMRRHDRETTPWPERVIVWVYWLVSGSLPDPTRPHPSPELASHRETSPAVSVHRRPTVAEPNRSATAGRRPSRRRGVEGAGCHSACHSTRYHAAQQDRTSWTAQLT